MLKIEGTDRFHATCASCMRVSPVLDGPLEAAKAQIKALGWAEGVDGDWHCTICTTRRTTKQKRFTGA